MVEKGKTSKEKQKEFFANSSSCRFFFTEHTPGLYKPSHNIYLDMIVGEIEFDIDFLLPPPPPPPPPAPQERDVFKIVEHMPTYGDCVDIDDSFNRKKCSEKNVIEFINENSKYPDEAKKEGIEGRVTVRFIVLGNGELSNLRILKSPSNSLGEEALRLVRKMGKWNPGKQKRKKSKSTIHITSLFPIK